MENRTNKHKQYMFIIIYGIISLPLLQFWIPFKYEDPLKGAVESVQKPNFERKNWWSGNFQEEYDKWFNQNFGFRNTAVRLHNQIGFSFFNSAKANGVIIGKENYLFEYNYIKAVTGKDFIGESEIIKRTAELKQIQELIESEGKSFVVTFAAGKGSFFSEFIPDSCGSIAPVKTNYKFYSKQFIKEGINFIDFNKWFIAQKNKSPYPLYSKTGIHWSMYGSLLVADSIIKYIENSKKIDMPSIVKQGIIVSDSMQGSDNDIGEGMNLLFPFNSQKMGYPNYHFEPIQGKVQPKLLVIADSYFWSIFDQLRTPSCFSEVTFRFYNKEIRDSKGNFTVSNGLEDWKEEIAKNDIVLLMVTDANLKLFPWGFSEQLTTSYNETEEQKFRRRGIYIYENKIKESSEWLEMVKQKASDRSIPLDSMIRADAIYMLDIDIAKGQYK